LQTLFDDVEYAPAFGAFEGKAGCAYVFGAQTGALFG
jgi:hypothetical protein